MDKNTVIGFVLIGALTVGYLFYQNNENAKARRAREQAEQQAAQQAAEAAKGEAAKAPELPAELKPESVGQETVPTTLPAGQALPTSPVVNEWPAQPVKGEEYEIRPPGGNYVLTFAGAGAGLKKATLLKYFADWQHTVPLVVLDECADGSSLMMTDPRDKAGLPLSAVNYELMSRDNKHIEFRHTFSDGLEVTKRFECPQGAYHIVLKVTLRNTSNRPLPQTYELSGGVRVVPEIGTDPRYLSGMIATLENKSVKIVRKAPSDLKKKENGVVKPKDSPVTNNVLMPIVWAGSADKYFAAMLAPLPPEGSDSTQWIENARLRVLLESEVRPKDNVRFDNAAASMTTKEITLDPGAQASHDYMLFVGPKDTSLFAKPEYRMFARVVDYGWFDFISVGLLYLLKLFYKVIPNYGVGIILLTLVVRVLVHPLTKKSQISMYSMQRLAPEIKKLQEKYKHDKQRLGREQMQLFKEHGVNPMGGCLPLLLQFPILIGLYRALELSIDLRDAPFLFWVHDLSRPDTINPAGSFPINILPIAMVISWIVQQKMMPKPPDPQQRRQQMIMAIVTTAMFGFIFYSMASGLTLYWFVSTMLGIGEQKIIQRSIRKMDAAKETKAAAKR